MSDFIHSFRQRGDISMRGMRETAMALLPQDRTALDKLYNELNRGTKILDDEGHLNMYLRSFGKMHKAKLDEAYRHLPNVQNFFAEDVEIYDWGCGQGIATVCLLDYLKSQDISPGICSINLVDPSEVAISRASDIIKCFNSQYAVTKTIKSFDELNTKDFAESGNKKLHLFSNILDVEAFDLAKFTNLFQKSFRGRNVVICVGPYYENIRRVDEFITAIAPDAMYGIMDRRIGEWQREWTISLRVFEKDIQVVESTSEIRRRIEHSNMHRQFFAGYILDAVSEEYENTPLSEDMERLFKSLSVFDVKSNITLEHNKECDSKLAVLANIISRGLPTKAPIMLEELFSDLFEISNKPSENAILNYSSKHKQTAEKINEALHIIDPRFNMEYYKYELLESDFERGFIENRLKGTAREYLIQLLEPQRPLSTIVDIPNKKFVQDQRVDFSLEIPYGDCQNGFIIEVDGSPFHSNIFQRLHDRRRDELTSENSWDTYRLSGQQQDSTLLNNWVKNDSVKKYLTTTKKNYKKEIGGEWLRTLQIVLSPIAIARMERMLVEAMMSGVLNVSAEEWNIVVVERDVPCAAIAVNLLKEKYKHICELAGTTDNIPKINICIVSTKEFSSSELHMGQKVRTSIPSEHFDLCVDISVLLRDNIDSLPLAIDADACYVIRSSHYKKEERTICMAENIIYPAFVEKDATGSYVSIKKREELLMYFLREIFRKPSFFKGQLPILSRALLDKTTIGLLPTGGGKSLAYQLSCMLQPGVAIIVDPLVSLMVDQVRGLRSIRIDTCDCINSKMDAREKSNKLSMLQNGTLMFTFLSPERYMMKNFRESLMVMTRMGNVFFSYGIIDEVHCVSEWGHDFRTAYLHLGRNMITFMQTKSARPLSIIGLTATASFDVLADVERELTLGNNLMIDSETIVRPEDDSRPELTYRIVRVDANFDEIRNENLPFILTAQDEWAMREIVSKAKRRRLFQLLEEIPNDLDSINERNDPALCIPEFSTEDFYVADNNKFRNAGIVFCPHTQGSFGVHTPEMSSNSGIASSLMANTTDLKMGTFVGGDDPGKSMMPFNENDLNLMVATKAFGMGIDKPNIRFTVNINHPSSLESYVQEAGRAGRDKKNAISYIIYEPTEYIHLTADKIGDIYDIMGEDVRWLQRYRDKFILLEDFPRFCRYNHATDDQIEQMLSILRTNNCLENVDKNIDLWFHNNSFRGWYKEKVILSEMTDRILNARPTILHEIQDKLRESTDNDELKLKIDRSGVAIVLEDDDSKQYGYVFLSDLHPVYKYANFDVNLCHNVTNKLIDILQTYEDHSVSALKRPVDRDANVAEGIYNAIRDIENEDYVFVTVSWENQIKQAPDDFEKSLEKEILSIAQKKDWGKIGKGVKLGRASDFDELLTKISKNAGDLRWLHAHRDTDLYEGLKHKFCEKRDKDDTDKAIYRMCCIGLVEDVTIDYLSQTYELKIRKRTDAEYKENMRNFFRKYYSQEQTEKRVEEIECFEGRNYMDKCLGYLTKFVYDNLERKRYRAIEDIRIACEDSIGNGRNKFENDAWLKEFIHLYFNSKYARSNYEVEGESYSLKEDTDIQGKDDFDVVRKYIDIMTEDPSGSEVDNVKHLYGATLLCLRAHPDNAALQLLLTYCITFLGAGTNETLKANAFNGYVEGFMSLYRRHGSCVWDCVDEFNNYIENRAKDDYVKTDIIEEGTKHLTIYIHDEKVDNIKQKYLN